MKGTVLAEFDRYRQQRSACRVAGINVAVLIGAMLAGICSSTGGLLQVSRLFSVDATMGEGDIQ